MRVVGSELGFNRECQACEKDAALFLKTASTRRSMAGVVSFLSILGLNVFDALGESSCLLACSIKA